MGKLRTNPGSAIVSARNSLSGNESMPSNELHNPLIQSMDYNLMPSLVKFNKLKRARRGKVFSLTKENSNEILSN